MKSSVVTLPPPDLQIAFAGQLRKADADFLQSALLDTVAQLPTKTIDEQLHGFVASESLRRLSSAGLRGELIFPVPVVLSARPKLLAYYRLLFGFSQKEFYLAKYGTSSFKRMEDCGEISPRSADKLNDLCKAFAECGARLLAGFSPEHLSSKFFDRLTLLTLGSQFRGSANVTRGSDAVRIVFDLIEKITHPAATKATKTRIEIENAAKRKVVVEFSSDPDISILEEIFPGHFTKKIAIEIKGGTDFSNIHNRIGEAEKSHQKAKQEGFTEFWTIVNVERFDVEVAERESPTTNRFYVLAELLTANGNVFQDFRSRLESLLGIRSAKSG